MHDSQATEAPDPIYLFAVCVCVGWGVVIVIAVFAHVGVYITCLILSVYLMFICV